MISLAVMSNFVEVVEMAVMPRGKTYDCSIAVTFKLSNEYDDMSELRHRSLNYQDTSITKNNVIPFRLIVDMFSLIQLHRYHSIPFGLANNCCQVLFIIMIYQPILCQRGSDVASPCAAGYGRTIDDTTLSRVDQIYPTHG